MELGKYLSRYPAAGLPLQRPWLEEEQEAREAGNRICWACKLPVRIGSCWRVWTEESGRNSLSCLLLLLFKLICITSHSSFLRFLWKSYSFSRLIHSRFECKPLLSHQDCLYLSHLPLYGIPDHPDLLNIIINPSTLFLMDHHLSSSFTTYGHERHFSLPCLHFLIH